MSKDYLPRRQADLDAWIDNFIKVFPAIAQQLGFTDTEIADLVALLQCHRDTFSAMNSKKQEASAAVAAHESVSKTTDSNLRKAVQRMKTHGTYTEEMGKTMNVIGSVDTTKLATQQMPELHLTINGGKIIIKFKKQGYQGIKIYCKRGSETEFTFLAIDTSSPYEDNRINLLPGQTEKREYLAYFIDNDEQTGLASAIYSITV